MYSYKGASGLFDKQVGANHVVDILTEMLKTRLVKAVYLQSKTQTPIFGDGTIKR